jgi:hypothetical protein
MQKLTNLENQESPGYSNRIYPDEDPSQKSPAQNSHSKITQKALIDIVKETENRKFSEDIDLIESLGGISLHFLLFHS